MLTFVRLISLLLVVAVVEAYERSVLVIVRENKGTLEIVHRQRSRHPHEQCISKTDLESDIHYTSRGMICEIKLPNEKSDFTGTRSEWLSDGHDYEGAFLDEGNIYSLYLPLDASNVTVISYRLRTSILSVGTILQGQDDVISESLIHTTEQTAGDISKTQNIIFLSAGYLKSSLDLFNSDVKLLVDFLQSSDTYPLSAYFSTLNVFTVFQPSNEEGASKAGLYVDNNLKCEYGDASGAAARRLRCDISLAIALTDTSPVRASQNNAVVVIIVNDNNYGGTGRYSNALKSATLYAGGLRDDGSIESARSLLYHEIGHALADLHDEYTIDATTEGRNCGPPFSDYTDSNKPLCAKNCAASISGIPWQGWIDKGAVSEPQQGCYYKNFYRSGSPCLMESVAVSTLCPICMEAMALQLYQNGMNLSYPSCPHPEWTVSYVSRSGSHTSTTLFANHKLYRKNIISYSWKVNGQSTSIQGSRFTFDGTIHSTGRHQVTLLYEDISDWILTSNRPSSVSGSVTWEIEVVDNMNELMSRTGQSVPLTCSSGSTFDRSVPSTEYFNYYAMCSGPDGQCATTYHTRQYETVSDLDESAKSVEGWLLGIGAAIISAGVFAFILLYCVVHHYSSEAKRVLEDVLATNTLILRRLLYVVTALQTLGTTGLMAYLAVMYTDVGSIAKVGVLVGIGTASVIFLVSTVSIAALWSKKKCTLIFSTLCNSVIAVVIVSGTGFLFHVAYTSNDDGSSVQKYLSDEWKSQVQSNPGTVCATQQHFKCSGWEASCDITDNDDCPVNCEVTNAIMSTPCKIKIIEFIHDRIPEIACVLLAAFYVLLIAVVLGLLLLHLINKSLELDGYKTELLESGPIEGLLSISKLHCGDKKKFKKKLETEFLKFDTSGTGSLDKLEFSIFFRDAIGVELKEEQVHLLFALIDVTGSGVLTLIDWMEVMNKLSELQTSEVIDFLSDRKDKAAILEDQRRSDRLRVVDVNSECPISLSHDDDTYDDAFNVYGRLDNASFYRMRDDFIELMSYSENGVPVVTVQDFRKALQKEFTFNLNSSRAREVLSKIPQKLNPSGTGEITWADWCATYFTRRDCSMRILRFKKPVPVVGAALIQRRSTVADIRKAARLTNGSLRDLRRPSYKAAQSPSSPSGIQIEMEEWQGLT